MTREHGRKLKPEEVARTSIPWVSVYLYVALALLASAGPPAANWAAHLELVPLVALLGAIAGVALAASRFGGRLAFFCAGWYGTFVTGWLLGETLDPALTAHDRALTLLGRIGVFLEDILVGRENDDALMAVLVLAVLYWSLSVAGAWVVVRRKGSWGAIIPLGLTLFVNAYYYLRDPRLEWMLAGYLLLGLVLTLNQELSQKRDEWQEIRSSLQSSAIPRFVRYGIQLVVILIFLGFAVPAFARSEGVAKAWISISGPWRSAQERIGKALSGLESPSWILREEFSETLSLEAGVATTDELVLEVEPFNAIREGGRFYWRARTYDTYRDAGWSTGEVDEIKFDPRQGRLEPPATDSRQEIEVLIQVWSAIPSVLYVPSQPIWASRSSTVLIQNRENGIADVLTFLSDQSVQRGERYRAVGLIAVPTELELRAAGTDYPEWVLSRYLQVPETVTPRTRQLAQLITKDLEAPYDQAAAITNWLRQNIEYQRVTRTPPEGREPLDWFLFDYRIGFCNFYASAEVIMLRTLGIPARLATGYAQGQYQEGTNTFEVIASEFHAWPEVYFPGIGWVEFEPTVAQPALSRLTGLEAGDEGSNGLRPGVEPVGQAEDFKQEGEAELAGSARPRFGLFGTRNEALSGTVALVLMTIAVVILLWTRVDAGWMVPASRWIRRAAQALGAEKVLKYLPGLLEIDSPATAAYARWLAWWPRLRLDPHVSETPHERALVFAKAEPSLADDAFDLVGMYSAERYGAIMVDQARIKALSRQLQRRLWRKWLNRLGLPIAPGIAGRRLHDLRDL